jgi:hypothetical protein
MRYVFPTFLFTLVAVASFSLWALGTSIFPSEYALYAGCAVVFLGFGGLALTPGTIVSGAPARIRFAGLFAGGFVLYSILWSVCWFQFHNTFGEVLGSFLGLIPLIALLKRYFPERQSLWTGVAVAFLWHTLGYYFGGFAYAAFQGKGVLPLPLPFDRETTVTLARLSWGLFYGLGLGFGLSLLLQRSRQS